MRQVQRGAILMVALMLLIVLTLMAIATFNFGKANYTVVGNAQQRMEATRSAEQVIEEVLSNPNIGDSTVTTWFATACDGSNAKRCVDINGDGNTDYIVTVTRGPCVTAAPILNSALDINVPNDAACSVGAGQSFGVEGATDGNSLCADVVREMEVVAKDSLNQTEVKVVQGFGVRTDSAGLSVTCN
ncbi:MAG TPA: hypothetical protein VJ001_04485 [Rhodocyclaceae bacterium]|nr:hypothetical protein [Rhodocyclaceae bacterium]